MRSTPSEPVADATRTSLTDLFAAERSGLVRLAAGLLGDRATAQDVVQDAYAALIPRWDTLVDPATAAGYLRVSVVNAARSVNRRRSLFARLPLAAPRQHSPPADFALQLAAEHRNVFDAVKALPPRQQQVVILRYWFDMSERDIAATLGVSTGTVKSSSARALATIEKTLGVHTDDN